MLPVPVNYLKFQIYEDLKLKSKHVILYYYLLSNSSFFVYLLYDVIRIELFSLQNLKTDDTKT